MYLEVIAELHYNKHDDVIHAYVSEACVSSSQSKCICAIKRFLVSSTAMYVSSSSFMYWRIPCYCDASLNSSALRVGVKTLLNKKYNDLYADQSWSVPQPAKKFGGAEVTFGNYYDVIGVQWTMMICDLFAMISIAAAGIFAKSLDKTIHQIWKNH